MKILLVNKFYYHRDGVSNYLLALEKQLTALGHTVRIFAMANPKNLPSPDKKYFVSYLSFDKPGLKNTVRALSRIFYSREAKKKFSALLDDFHPDVIHIHNIYHHISPSILPVATAAHIPVVMHLHDYKLICPNYKLFTKGQVCEKCHDGHYYHCFFNKCLKNSYLKSLGGSLEMYAHHKLWPVYKRHIELFIAPSQFMKNICQNFGWPENKIIHLPNFYDDKAHQETKSEKRKNGDEPYFLYYGRLAEEKGVAVILKTLSQAPGRLKIAGEGPEAAKLKNLSTQLKLENRVDFLGFQTGANLDKLIREATAVIVPSIWLENMPLNVLEALARHKIVIASSIGGIPEIIQNGRNGILFTAGSSEELAKIIKNLDNLNLTEIEKMAGESVKDFNIISHTQEILKIYTKVLKNKI
ncbi:MAG: glycosyltransferase [Patescibacteria group bacterium]